MSGGIFPLVKFVEDVVWHEMGVYWEWCFRGELMGWWRGGMGWGGGGAAHVVSCRTMRRTPQVRYSSQLSMTIHIDRGTEGRHAASLSTSQLPGMLCETVSLIPTELLMAITYAITGRLLAMICPLPQATMKYHVANGLDE